MVQSILDTLSSKITGIITPVSLTMAITVWLVRHLNPGGTTTGSAVAIANIYYHEQVWGLPCSPAIEPARMLTA